MKQQVYFFVGVLMIFAGLYGCSSDEAIQNVLKSVNNINPQNSGAAIEDPFAILGTENESVAFGDADISGTEESSVPLTKSGDGITGNTAPLHVAGTSLGDCPKETHFIRMRWGKHFRRLADLTSTGTPVAFMNWSGALTASSGELTLVRTILFESVQTGAPSLDLIKPQADPNVISFDSYTKEDYDGLWVKYQRCMPDTATSSTITFSASNLLLNAFSKTWTLAELHKINEVYKDVDENHDSFQIQAVTLEDQCPDKYKMGHGIWFKVNEDFGQIKGRVVKPEGEPAGHIKGFYSLKKDADGKQKFVAKYINHDGKFKGILIGTAKDGDFQADVSNHAKVKIGMVTGKYEEGNTSHKGTFSAIYESIECPVPK